jgi:Second Messenger Oligonucleotide or Dinucleotide Synthetase domain
MTPDEYLRGILNRIRVDSGPNSPVRSVLATVQPSIAQWAGQYLQAISPSGSFAKGTAISSGTDIDFFVSLTSATPNTLKEIYNTLFKRLADDGYNPRRQNVSIGTTIRGYSVDIVPAKRQDSLSQDHSLYRNRADTWTKTNVTTHINTVRASSRADEIMVLKAWRNQKGLDFPSFYLELVAIEACKQRQVGYVADNVWGSFEYIKNNIETAGFLDPANTNNRISDDLTAAAKKALAKAATDARTASDWSQIVQ